ncbi:MAG: PxKF domain-containing protein [Actinomycetota bacterium]
MTLALLVLLPGLAFADNVQNDAVSATVSAGSPSTVNYRIIGNGTDGCNVDATHAATMTFVSSPAGATASPSSLSFTECQDSNDSNEQAVSFTASSPGTYTITPSVSGGKADNNGWNTNPGKFTLTVNAAAPSDTTAPTITPNVSGTLGNNGWYVSDVTVSWTVVDPDSAISASSGCGSATLSADSAGMTYTCSATSAGGTNSQSVTVKRDATAPAGVSVAADRAPDSNGWYTAPFTATWTGNDATSGIDSCTQTAYSGPDDSSGSLSGSCEDKAGNDSASVPFAFKFDATGPTVVGTPDRAADHNGWYNHAVTITWSVSGDTSGEGTCDAPTTYSGPSSNAVTLTGHCTDGAGNPGTGTFGAFKYDAVAPVASIAADRSPDANGWYNHSLIGTTSATDDLSGVASCTAPQTYSGPDADDASLSGTCTDAAGNTSTPASMSFDYDATGPVAAIAADRPADSNGWYNHSLIGTTTATDNLSGVASCSGPQTYSGPDTATGSLSGSCTDNAGNASNTASLSFKYDATAPVAGIAADRDPDANGWYNHKLTATTTATDNLSGVATCSDPQDYEGPDTASGSLSGSCSDNAGNASNTATLSFKYDATAPVASIAANRAPDSAGWYNHSFVATTTGTDNLSGIGTCSADQVYGGPDTAAGSLTGSCTDVAGNASNTASMSFKYDGTAPFGFIWTGGGPVNGGTYYFGFVPAAPSGCTANDALSGFASCAIDGYSNAVGSHSMTATAYDVAGNSGTDTRTYTVGAWTIRGFYQPVDMNGVLNTVKNGSTVPLKWEVFAGPTELTDTSIISTLQKQITCGTSAPEDTVEVTATGGTSLRYDTTGGQFIFNWQTPKRPGTCWAVTMTTADGSSISANFKLK